MDSTVFLVLSSWTLVLLQVVTRNLSANWMPNPKIQLPEPLGQAYDAHAAWFLSSLGKDPPRLSATGSASLLASNENRSDEQGFPSRSALICTRGGVRSQLGISVALGVPVTQGTLGS